MMSEEADHMEGCRTCGVFSPLQYNFLRHIFSTDTDYNMENIRNVLKSLNIQIDELDGLPQYICTQCILNVEKICEFQRTCLEVQEELRQWYFVDKIKMKIKEETVEHSKMQVEENAEEDDGDCIFICVDDLGDYEYTPKMSIKAEPPAEKNIDSCTTQEVSEEVISTTESSIDNSTNNNTNSSSLNETIKNVDSINDEINAVPSQSTSDYNTVSIRKNDYYCYTCNKSFVNVTHQRFKNHISWHKLEKRKKVKCSCCGFTCLSPAQLKQHRRMVHASKTCTICNKLISASQFKIHMLQHRAAGLSICRICEKEFESETDRDDHIIQAHSNTDVKLHKCEDDKQRTAKNAIDNNNSNNENSNVDPDVEILFEPVETVQISDNEEKQMLQFECPICAKTFGLQFSLNRHLKRH